MANELHLIAESGLTVTASVLTDAGVVIATGVACAESGATGVYFGDMPSAPVPAAGRYIIAFAGAAGPAGYALDWDGSAVITGVALQGAPAAALSVYDGPTRAELTSDVAGLAAQHIATQNAISALTIPTAIENAQAVRTNLAAELARMDVPVSTRLAATTYVAPDNAGIAALPTAAQIATAVWTSAVRSLTDKAGFTLTAAERDAIAVAVETAILNEGDGRAIINAIVGAIGNMNVDELSLAATIRADLERAGGLLDLIETKAEADARQLTLVAGHDATQSAIGALNDISSAQVRTQVDAGLAAATVSVDNGAIAAATRSELTVELARLDAPVSSRSTFDPANDVVANVTHVATNADMRGTDDALLAASYAAPLDAAATASAVQAGLNANGLTVPRAALLVNIDATVSSRLAAADYSAAPDVSGLATQADIAALANSTFTATLSGDDATKLNDLHTISGLNLSTPVEARDDGVIAGDINLTITDANVTTTLQRQPPP
ncbi:MAG: hypothetical protein AAF360_00040 [Pseudomonadota bacterium]